MPPLRLNTWLRLYKKHTKSDIKLALNQSLTSKQGCIEVIFRQIWINSKMREETVVELWIIVLLILTPKFSTSGCGSGIIQYISYLYDCIFLANLFPAIIQQTLPAELSWLSLLAVISIAHKMFSSKPDIVRYVLLCRLLYTRLCMA